MRIEIEQATLADAAAIAGVRTRAAEFLTQVFGGGPWSMRIADGTVAESLVTPLTLVARAGSGVVGTLRLQGQRPRSIRIADFTPVRRPLYVVDVAVAPNAQRQGIGRLLVDAAYREAIDWPGDSLRLDTYHDAAGAGDFYLRCGYRCVARHRFHDIPLAFFERVIPIASRRRSPPSASGQVADGRRFPAGAGRRRAGDRSYDDVY
ncbi:MAG: GNAT family N-acetyltransferase [Gemmatimonadaceae bacterium]|nr:GNAT family N-acetyltransferase [Gemmatimonadaceae bacterium]